MKRFATFACTLLLSTAAFAQTRPATATDPNGNREEARPVQRAVEDRPDYGWLGLLGLAGLAGLRRRKETIVGRPDVVRTEHDRNRDNIRKVS